jgi:hypothetical protein
MKNRFVEVILRLPLVAFFAGTSLAIGLAIPVFFELLQSPTSRQSITKLGLASGITFLLTVTICSAWVWMGKIPDQPQDISAKGNLQINIAGILSATTFMAVAIAVTQWLNEAFALGLIGACLLASFSWGCFQTPAIRDRVLVLMVNMFLPFAWVFAFSRPIGQATGLLIGILIGPGLLPAEGVRALVSHSRPQDSVPLAVVFVIAQLGLGIWLAKVSGRLSTAYSCLALTMSSVASFGLHAMYRM